MCTYVVHDFNPSFHRDALEDGQHCEAEVVEAGDAAVRSDPVRVADPAQLRRALVALAARPRRIQHHPACIRTRAHTVSAGGSTAAVYDSSTYSLRPRYVDATLSVYPSVGRVSK